MKRHLIIYTGLLGLIFGLASCSNDETESLEAKNKNVITFDIQHPAIAQTRATDTSFESGDKVGVFLTNSGQPIDIAGNYVTNVSINYNGSQWKPAQTLYWNDGQYDAYGYYPYSASISSVSDMPFSVQTDQSTAANYTASDFLWAQKKKVTASNGRVGLTFAHRMSRLMIRLVKGDDYEGDLPDDAEVYVHNTVTDATIDLNVGLATRNAHAAANTIHARSLGNHRYTALVIPQRLDNRQPLVEVISHGVSYLYESKFLFKPGVQHNILLTLSNNPEQIKIEIGGEIENWSK